jgi:N-methylhydantoinase A
MATRIGVDIGGTFTDLIFYDDQTGDVHVAKTATTPGELERGVLNAVESAVPAEKVPEVEYFMHGTTIALNALLTRSGAPTGLICTAGFRDVIEIGRGDRPAMYDIFWKQPLPLVKRRHRLTVRERIRADGEILAPLEEDDVVEALQALTAAGMESIAVCLMNSYANPVHELAVERLLAEQGFEGEVSLSHRLSREYREYERSSTTVVDAYIRPVTGRYLSGLVEGLQSADFQGEVLVTRSGGGAITADELKERPFEAIQSGPVAGAEGAAELAREHGWDLAITADVGGTSFDTALIIGGRPQVKHEGSIVGWPLQTSWVDVVSIGAGGGSIAYADNGLLRVGPQSAGAVPGPACYGSGGTDPTVTDAALVLGMLGDGVLSSGLTLDASASRTALEPLAGELELGLDEAAQGVLRVATSSMAEAIREITIGQGEDPREAKLLVFGGAGPLFGTLLAGELDIPEIVVPPHAGNFSAWGLLGQDVTHEAAHTSIRVLTEALIPALNENLSVMFEELEARHAGENGSLGRTIGLDLRYVGQEHTLNVQLPSSTGQLTAADVEPAAEAFATNYERRFGTTLAEELELVTLRATTRQSLPRKEGERAVSAERTGVERAPTIRSFSFTQAEPVEFGVIERADLARGSSTEGPLIVFEPTATIYVDAGYSVSVDDSTNLSLSPTTAGGSR